MIKDYHSQHIMRESDYIMLKDVCEDVEKAIEGRVLDELMYKLKKDIVYGREYSVSFYKTFDNVPSGKRMVISAYVNDTGIDVPETLIKGVCKREVQLDGND